VRIAWLIWHGSSELILLALVQLVRLAVLADE
jgi:hypothetical protein